MSEPNRQRSAKKRETVVPDEPHARRDRTGAGEHDADPIRDIGEQIAEFREYLGYYVRAREDSVRLALRDISFRFRLQIATLVVSVAVCITAVVHLFEGAARGFTLVVGGREWAGNLLAGLSGAFMLGFVSLVCIWHKRRANHRRMVREYEALKEQQRERFGRDVGDNASGRRREGLPAKTGEPCTNRHGTGANGHATQRSQSH